MKRTGLFKKIGKILDYFRSTMPENPAPPGKKPKTGSPEGDLRRGTQRKKDFPPETDLTTNIDRYRHPSEF
jgi:hypothetical protein